MMSLQGSLSIEHMCRLVSVSRRGFYRSLQERQPAEEEMEGRSVIQQIALEHRRRYGYRRITAELHRRGMQVNHKRVVRIMREDNLLGIQPKRFVVTTNSDHKFEVYLNLASRMKLTGINQLWVADFTYIRLKAEFVYLGGDPRWVFPPRGGLGSGSHPGGAADPRGAGASHRETATGTRVGAPLGPRISIRLRRICRPPREARYGSQHEPSSQPV